MYKNKLLLVLLGLFLFSFATVALAQYGKQEASQADKELLGSILYKDQNLSANQNQSCESCHMAPSYVDPDFDVVTGNYPVSEGSNPGDFGGRNAPAVAYAMGSPAFSYVEGTGYVGGQFWDGRANGLIAQAKGPFLNPVEMAMEDKAAVVAAIKNDLSSYQDLFSLVYGVDLANLDLNSQRDVTAVYNDVADAIAAYESSDEVNKFNSSYDAYLGGAALSGAEERGRVLFQANCSQCHPMDGTITAHQKTMSTVFSSFTYHNLGLPHNYKIDELQGTLDNPQPDLGLGGREDIQDPAEYGKFKTPTLRNIALTAPYGHNGYFPTLEEMVHFLNDRGNLSPDVEENISDEVGSLGLTDGQVRDIVAFLNTLTDQ